MQVKGMMTSGYLDEGKEQYWIGLMLAGGKNATKTASSRVPLFQQNSTYTTALAYRITATRKHSRNPNGSKILL